MDTKRCAYCHKLQRADARTCSGCGHVFIEKQQKTPAWDVTHPSLPPASPHRAGHYAGLHPEDQPYQSGKMIAQHAPPRPRDEEPRTHAPREPERIILPESPTLPTLPMSSRRPIATDEPLLDDSQPTLPLDHSWDTTDPTRPIARQRKMITWSLPGIQRLLSLKQNARIQPFLRFSAKNVPSIPSILAVLIILILLGSSIIAFAQINNGALVPKLQPATPTPQPTPTMRATSQPTTQATPEPTVQSTPKATAKPTPTAQATSTAQTQQAVQATPEPAILYISTTTLSYSATTAQNPTDQRLVLHNSGGQTFDWVGTPSNPWLSLSPNGGRLDPNTSAIVIVSAQSQGLKVGSYQGSITITGAAGALVSVTLNVSAPSTTTTSGVNASITPTASVTASATPDATAKATVTTTVTVNAPPVRTGTVVVKQAVITVSASTLKFSSSNAAPANTQSLVITNSGSADLHWLIAPSPSSAASSWLSFNTTSGSIDPSGSATVNIRCDGSSLIPGTYTITLIVGDSDSNSPVSPQTVQVTMVVQ